MTIELGSEWVTVRRGNKRQLTDKKHTFQNVPILDGLQSLLAKDEIIDEA